MGNSLLIIISSFIMFTTGVKKVTIKEMRDRFI